MLSILDNFVIPARSLSPPVLAFLSRFPEPLDHLAKMNPALLQQVVSHHKKSLTALALEYHKYTAFGNNLKVLPLPYDLARTCFIQSTVLQRLVFGTLLRHAWGIGDGTQVMNAISRFEALQSRPTPYCTVPEAWAHYKYFQDCYLRLGTGHPSATLWSDAMSVLSRSLLFINDDVVRSEGRPTSSSSAGSQAQARAQARGQVQAQVQSPRVAESPVGTTEKSMTAASTTVDALHRFVSGFKCSPSALSAVPSVRKFTFDMTKDELDRGPQWHARQSRGVPTGTVGRGTLSYRLRCCVHKDRSQNPDEANWVVRETKFPPYVYFSLNERPLTTPMPDQHHKFQPLEISAVLQAGQNTLTVYINRLSTIDPVLDSALAIEEVFYESTEGIRSAILRQPPISAQTTLASIKSSLNSDSTTDGDDDLVVVESTLTIPLYEPFSNAKIFDIPVRGASCVHRQAFDLDIYLQTRPKAAGSAISLTDAWKCPICGRDARPIALVVDGFLVEVRAELERRGLLKIRAIVVDKNGDWTPKVEKESRSPVAHDPGRMRSIAEVIDLDSD